MILSSLYKPLEMLTDILKYLDNKRISKSMWRLCLLISLLELTTLKEKMESVAPSKSAIVLGFRDFLPLVSCHHISHNHYALPIKLTLHTWARPFSICSDTWDRLSPWPEPLEQLLKTPLILTSLLAGHTFRKSSWQTPRLGSSASLTVLAL